MKKILSISICFVTLLFFSCKSEIEQEPLTHQACVDFFLDKYEMIEYDGGTFPCTTTYLVLFENGDTKFAIPHNTCADLLPHMLIDCNGNELCIYVTEAGCFEMVQNSINLGTIGVAD